ncbi:MAG: hypothetical protein ACRCYU_18400, partial [Nocardioides sp.]
FVAGGSEVRASTLRQDPVTGDAEVGQVAVWFAVPVARDVLLAAWMIGGLGGVGRSELDRMSDGGLREYAVHSLLMEGTDAVQVEIGTEAFASGYRGEVVEVAEYAAAVASRLDQALFASVAVCCGGKGAAGVSPVRGSQGRPPPTSGTMGSW